MAIELIPDRPGTTRGQLNRAGVTLRTWWNSDGLLSEEVVEAFELMRQWRETFQIPLSKTASGLRSMVRSEWPEKKALGSYLPVVQRLKRSEQIMFKLSRMPQTELCNMGDVGGCRAVLRDRGTVDRVARRIRKNWDIVGDPRDTRDKPAASGYRALHFIVRREGRRVEVQLRDEREHEWALAVERTGNRLGLPLKEGLGPAELMEYFRIASEGMYRDSRAAPRDPAFDQEFEASRERASSFFIRSPP